MLTLLIDLLPYLALPVAGIHIFLDLFDKHRHGIRLHDWVGFASYAAFALHFAYDLKGMF